MLFVFFGTSFKRMFEVAVIEFDFQMFYIMRLDFTLLCSACSIWIVQELVSASEHLKMIIESQIPLRFMIVPGMQFCLKVFLPLQYVEADVMCIFNQRCCSLYGYK